MTPRERRNAAWREASVRVADLQADPDADPARLLAAKEQLARCIRLCELGDLAERGAAS